MTASPNFPKLPADWKEDSLFVNSNQIHLRIYGKNDLQGGRLLFLIHGQGEQSDRYEHFPSYLRSCVDAIVCVDLPGHGRSQGNRGHIENFDQYSQAVLLGLEAAQKWFASKATLKKTYLFGHSLGGLIAIRTLFLHANLNLAAVSISAPLLDVSFPIPRLKSFFGKLVEPLLGRIKLDNELDANLLSHDPEVVAEYSRNPLNHHWVSPRFFVQLMKEMEETRNNVGPFAYNLLLESPLNDGIVSSKASFQFFKNLKMQNSRIKEVTAFPGFFHESFNEIGKERAFTALEAWLLRF